LSKHKKSGKNEEACYKGYFREVLGVDEPTDTEIAVYVLRIMDNLTQFQGSQTRGIEKDTSIRLAKNALKIMANPYAKKLLMDKIK